MSWLSLLRLNHKPPVELEPACETLGIMAGASFAQHSCESQENQSANFCVSKVLPLLLAALGLQILAAVVEAIALAEVIRVLSTGLLCAAWLRSPGGLEVERTIRLANDILHQVA
eukprot:s2_g70.t1